MEEELKVVSRLQKKAARDVVIQRYDYLVKHVKTIHILPHLVSSKLVEPDFHQYLDGERTERSKMMVLLRELLSNPMESWFRDFIDALSKYSPYQTVVDVLLTEFTKLMEEWKDHPPRDDGGEGLLSMAKAPTSVSKGTQIVEVTVPGVNEVLSKALEEAQEGYKATLREAQAVMKDAKDDHKAALLELKKTNERVLEAEKGKCFAEAAKKALEEKVREIGIKLSGAEDKLSVADGKLKEAEMQMQLLKKEAESYKDEVKETHDKMEEENIRLASDLAELRLQEEAARMRVQETERERAALETRVVSLQAEVESGRREREEELACHERQLRDARRQQEMVEGELKVVWKEMGEKQKRLEDATRQLDELQSSREEEVGHLKEQLERTTAKIGALEGELTEARLAEAKVKEFNKELEMNLAEQAKTKERQDEKERRMTMELKAAISDRDSVKKSHQVLGEEMEKVKGELVVKQSTLEDATRQLNELQSSREEEVSHLKEQLERTTTKMGALEGELTEARFVEAKVKEFNKELEMNLAEQVKTKKRQDQKERRMTIELKAAISDRDSLKKNQQALWEEMEKELSLTREKLEDATRQQVELQSSREEEVSHLKEQLERTTTKMGALEGELTEARFAEAKVKEFNKELEKNLAEQAKARGKQEEKERRMAVELEAAIFERESLKKSHQALGEKLKAELALTQANLAEKVRQEQKVNGLTKALEEAEVKHEAVSQELDRVKAALTHTETERTELETQSKAMEQKLMKEMTDKKKQLAELQARYRDKEAELEQFQKKHEECDVTKALALVPGKGAAGVGKGAAGVKVKGAAGVKVAGAAGVKVAAKPRKPPLGAGYGYAYGRDKVKVVDLVQGSQAESQAGQEPKKK